MRCNHEREDSNAFGHTVTSKTLFIHSFSECTRHIYLSSNINHVFQGSANRFQNSNMFDITTSSFQNVRQKSNGRIFLSSHLAPLDSGWSIQWTLRRCGDGSWRWGIKRSKVHPTSIKSVGIVYLYMYSNSCMFLYNSYVFMNQYKKSISYKIKYICKTR